MEIYKELLEIELKKPFLVVLETLTRIGIANHETKKLTQSCHLWHKEGKYYLAHFKTLFGIHGNYSSFNNTDKIRLNSIAKILENWKMIEILDVDKMDTEINTNSIFVLPHSDKNNWNLVAMFKLPEEKKHPLSLTIMSDTHGLHDSVILIEKTDVLIFAGDFMNSGKSEHEIIAFKTWLDKYRHLYEKVIVIAGNHDILFEDHDLKYLLTDYDTNNVFYLENESFQHKGWKFWGSPYTPAFMNWAFMMDREQLRDNWDKIPNDTEILISHGPPYGYCDQIRMSSENLGCKELKNRITSLPKLKLNCFGHIHGGYRKIEVDGVIYANASICTEAYKPINLPHIITLG